MGADWWENSPILARYELHRTSLIKVSKKDVA